MVVLAGLIASLVGLFTSVYIYRKKRTKTKLICPLRANCDKVIYSTHSVTFGIPNELLGIAYYIAIGLLYALMILNPVFLSSAALHYIIVILTIAGILFSLFLITLQAVVIRAWCSWCMLSALANVVLGLCLLFLPLNAWIELLGYHRQMWLIAHGIGFILGVGAATVSDIFFFKFLKDFKITEEEKKTFETLSNIIWTGLAVLIVSGLMLYLPAQARLEESSKFLLKIIVVGMILLNGIVLNLYVSPRLRQLSFDGGKPATHYRRIAFALGGISIVSWYSAFLLGSLRNISLSLQTGVVLYVGILFITIVGSQVFERLTVRKYTHNPHPPQK